MEVNYNGIILGQNEEPQILQTDGSVELVQITPPRWQRTNDFGLKIYAMHDTQCKPPFSVLSLSWSQIPQVHNISADFWQSEPAWGPGTVHVSSPPSVQYSWDRDGQITQLLLEKGIGGTTNHATFDLDGRLMRIAKSDFGGGGGGSLSSSYVTDFTWDGDAISLAPSQNIIQGRYDTLHYYSPSFFAVNSDGTISFGKDAERSKTIPSCLAPFPQEWRHWDLSLANKIDPLLALLRYSADITGLVRPTTFLGTGPKVP